MPNKKLREKRRRDRELSRASAATEEADASNTEQKSEDVRHNGETASDIAIPSRGLRFKEELPAADAPLPNQGRFKERLPAADEDGTPNVDIGLCIFAPRVAKEIERRNTFQAEQLLSRREPQSKQRQRREKRTPSQEQMPPPPRPRAIQPSRIKKRRRRNDESHHGSPGLPKTKVAIRPGPQDPQLSRTNGELDSQVKSARHQRIQGRVRRNLGLHPRTSRKDESNNAENIHKLSVARLPGLVELCNTAFIMMTLKDPCPKMQAIAQKPGSVPDQTRPSTLLISEATRRQLSEELTPGQQSYTRQDQHRKARPASPILNPPSPSLEPASVSTTQKTFFLDELLFFYQIRELHTINTGPATLYSCAAHDAKVEGAILAYPSFILLHAGKKYPEWPSLSFSSTEDTEEEFGCIHSLPRVHKDRQPDAVPVFKEVTWLIRKVSAADLEKSDRKKRITITIADSVPEGVEPASPNPGIGRSTESSKTAKTVKQSKTLLSVLSEDSNERSNGRNFKDACPEDFLEGRRATFLGWYDILGVRYHQRRSQVVHDKIQRMRHEFRTRVGLHPAPREGSATQQVSPKVVENYQCLPQSKGEVRKETQMPPEGPPADANPLERSFAATPGRMSPPLSPRPPLIWEPMNPKSRAQIFEFSKDLEARASAQSPSLPPAPSSYPPSKKPEPAIPFTAHVREKDCWTLIWGEAFVNVTLAPASPKSLGRVVDRHGEEALTDPLTKGYKHSVTVADDGLSCEIEGTDAPDGDAVYDASGRRFGRACAVRNESNNGSGGDDGKSGSRSESDGKVGVDGDDFGNPYAGTEGRRRDGINGDDEQIDHDHVTVEERSADANGVHDAEGHDHDDNDEPDDINVKENSNLADSTGNPVPPNFIYRPSMTFTVPATATDPIIEALGLTWVQRIVRQACDRDLQHVQQILQGMCRLQSHRHLVEMYKMQLHEAKRQETQQFEWHEKRDLDCLRRIMAAGEVEASWAGVLEATKRKKAALGRKGDIAVLGKSSTSTSTCKGDRRKKVAVARKGDSDVPGLSSSSTCKGTQGDETDTLAGDAPDKEEWPDTTGATPMTQEEEDKCRDRGDFWMSW